jgi:fibronectin type 3 domain-containing protein
VSCPSVDVAYTRPATPTGVTATGGNLQATLAWGASTGATGYNVKRSTTNGSGYTTLGNSPTAPVSPYIDTGLTGSTTYYYVVSSVNTIPSCESANSTQVSVVPGGTCTPPAIPTVTATGGNGQVALTWTASTGATSYAIARSVTSGTGYATIQVVSTGTSYSDVNVVNGTTYYYVITASNGSCSSRNSVQVSAAPACTPPAAPTAVVATPSSGSVALTWTAPAGAVSYRILRSPSAGSGYVLVGTSATASYTDTTVANGTVYFYVVTASNGSCSSANSAEVSAAPACVPPSVPTGVTATPGNGQVALAWSASSGGATLYRVLRATVAGGPYTAIATPAGTGYTDTGVSNSSTYYYVISASNGSCTSANSAEVSAKPVCTPPPVPTGLAATPGDSQVGLTWDASAGATSFTVSRSTVSGGAYASVGTASVPSYTNVGLTNGTKYYFVVSASNGSCSSVNSSEVSATPAFVCTQAAPTGLVATAGNKQVSLSWTAAAGATSYGIARSTTSGSGYASVGSVNAPATTFADTDPTLVNGTTYYYVVSAASTCTSANSAQASAKPMCTPPAVPSGVTAVNDGSNGHITVTWSASSGATAYTVSRNTAATGTFSAVSTNQTAASFSDSSALTAGNTYYYVVSASNAGGACASDNSSPAVSAMSCSLPAVPIGLTATVGTSGQVALTWTASSGATSYNILRSTSSGGTYASVGTATTTSFTNTGLTNDTTYYYVVAARNGSNGNCSSANSTPPLASTPRACQVLSSAINAVTFNTVGSYCFVTCYDFAAGSWQCSNLDGRTININGSTVACAAAPPAKSNGAYTFNVSAGTYSFAYINWWGTAHACPP